MKPNYVTEKPASFDWEEIGFSVFLNILSNRYI